jgi:hypothetical protein
MYLLYMLLVSVDNKCIIPTDEPACPVSTGFEFVATIDLWATVTSIGP